MYLEHWAFQPPEDEQSKMWRYMDFTKYVSLLETEALFFVSTTKLEDPYEGMVPEVFFEQFPEMSEVVETQKILKSFIGISSWHLSEYESAAMWKVFVSGNEGIAVRTTFARLRDCFKVTDRGVFIGTVQYVDYLGHDAVSELKLGGDTLLYYVRKRRSFEYEREVRAVIVGPPTSRFAGDSGWYVRVELDVLIESVFVSPGAEDWYLNLVRAVTGRYGLEKEVIRSSLLDGPIY